MESNFNRELGRPVIITPGSSVAALGFTRSLGEQGVPVIALGGTSGPGLFSKYCRAMARNGLSERSVLIETVMRIAESLHQRPVLLACSDDAARTISLNKSALERCMDAPVFDTEVGGACLTKTGLHDAAEKLGVPQPQAYFPEGLEGLARIAESIDYPCVLKPDNSKEFYRAFGVKAVIARSRDELIQSYVATASRNIRAFVQEYVPGETDANYGFAAYFDRDSRPHCAVTYRRLREWPPNSLGITAMAVSIDAPKLLEQASRFFSGLKYHGIAQAEFKRDPRDNQWKILDVNPRAWTSNLLATRCGCNIPYAAYLDCNGLSLEGSRMRPSVKWVNITDAFFSSLSGWGRGQLSLSECLRPMVGGVADAVFDWRDLKPFAWVLRTGAIISHFGKVWQT